MGFPNIPGVPSPEGLLNPVYDYDFGPDFNYADQSGVITRQPPVVKQVPPAIVPRVDTDGNDVGGVPSVLRQAPLGTYTGWNVIASGFDRGKICLLNGSFVPFAKTIAERAASGDPRRSLEERYGNHRAYVDVVRAAAEKAVAERFLLREDADRLIAEATASEVLVDQRPPQGSAAHFKRLSKVTRRSAVAHARSIFGRATSDTDLTFSAHGLSAQLPYCRRLRDAGLSRR